VNLIGLDAAGLERFFAEQGEKPFRARQVLRWIHQRGETDFTRMSDIAKTLRDKLAATTRVDAPVIVGDTLAEDGTRKWLLKVDERNAVEAVFIPETNRGTLCVSSQAGCVLDCAFCSTGKQGFNRNLSTAEIIGQLWLANRLLEVAIEALLAGGAERAVEHAARLARHAQRAAVRLRNEYRLDRIALIDLEEPLARSILRQRVADDDRGINARRRGELVAQRLRDVAHAGEIRLAALMDPAQGLARAERLLALLGEEAFQPRGVQADQIHLENTSHAGKK
jgi:hypothetical protein